MSCGLIFCAMVYMVFTINQHWYYPGLCILSCDKKKFHAIVGVAVDYQIGTYSYPMLYPCSFCSTHSPRREVNAFVRWGEVVMMTHVVLVHLLPLPPHPGGRWILSRSGGEVVMVVFRYSLTPKGGECLDKVGCGGDVDTCLCWCAPQVNSFAEWCEVAMVARVSLRTCHGRGKPIGFCDTYGHTYKLLHIYVSQHKPIAC